jgi:hypothetical protein
MRRVTGRSTMSQIFLAPRHFPTLSSVATDQHVSLDLASGGLEP